ncbi:GMP synthase (glutamine-hydrolyzing) [Malassezia caprae]|uniref:GMP synthase (Glutamine-hydrolyzing) n=1 Tax=Malassezia caprae TaxID=1381934 RepID=A0AAF0IVF6_9BASI|nr:GMP synthase (glutamine-hydrolyzing) [Malassezia caprae]
MADEDAPPKELQEKYGGYEVMFRNTLAEAMAHIPRHKWHPKISLHLQAFNILEAEFPDIAQLDDGLWDAVIVTGSPASATMENVLWMDVLTKYLQHLVLEHPLVRIIGVGFGHQLIARAFGAQLAQDKNRAEFGVTKFNLTPEGTEILSPFDKETVWALQQAHIDRVIQPPPPVEGDPWIVLGGNETTEIQGLALRYPSEAPPLPSSVKTSSFVVFDVDDMVANAAGPMPVRGVHVLTLQGHPEYNKQVAQDLIRVLASEGVIDSCVGQKSLDDAAQPHQGLECGKIMLGMVGIEPATVEVDL